MTPTSKIGKAIVYGVLASIILLGVYFTILTLVSGWDFAQNQFFTFWYFIMSLSLGFGIQMGLYTYLRILIKETHGEGKILGVTGVTSTTAMISCCAHYLANILPVLGTASVLTIVAQYQVEFFWVGILFNLGGIYYIAQRVNKFLAQNRFVSGK
jgi:Cu+-exporting ATPase